MFSCVRDAGVNRYYMEELGLSVCLCVKVGEGNLFLSIHHVVAVLFFFFLPKTSDKNTSPLV